MKKIFMFLTLMIFFLFSGCIITNDFSNLQLLALKAIANGSVNTSANYSQELKEIAETAEEKAFAYMASGYSHFLNENYQNALFEFETSSDFSFSEDAAAGILLTLFMLNQYELVDYRLDILTEFKENWSFTLNSDELKKTSLYEIAALSNAIRNNKQAFDTLKSIVPAEKMQEMEVFFFE